MADTAVPWIFASMLNDFDYDTGRITAQSMHAHLNGGSVERIPTLKMSYKSYDDARTVFHPMVDLWARVEIPDWDLVEDWEKAEENCTAEYVYAARQSHANRYRVTHPNYMGCGLTSPE